MGQKINNHYLSKCISKNFVTMLHQPFYEYDCNDHIIRKKSPDRLFAERRLWGQELEEILDREFENQLAKDLQSLLTLKINDLYLDNKGYCSSQFSAKYIDDRKMVKRLSKLILQSQLVKLKNEKLIRDKDDEHMLAKFYSLGFTMEMPAMICKISDYGNYPPLILIDSMPFVFFVPEKDEVSKTCGHCCFMFPISTKRFLIWGGEKDIKYFAMTYKNIHYLNLCRIEQNGKKCRIATQDKNYLDLLVKQISFFQSQMGNVFIETTR